MPLSSNYIRVKSQKELEMENQESRQRVFIAGTNDAAPGGTRMPIPLVNPLGLSQPTGILPPNTFFSSTDMGGDALRGSTHRNWTASAGIGNGGVGGPPEVPRTPLADLLPNRYLMGDKTMRRRMYETTASQRIIHTPENINYTMPNDVYASGTLIEGTDYSVGRDIHSVDRIIRRRYRPFPRGF